MLCLHLVLVCLVCLLGGRLRLLQELLSVPARGLHEVDFTIVVAASTVRWSSFMCHGHGTASP
jgi:hypothetical protein